MAKSKPILTGVVTNIDDPNKSGRIKIRVAGVNDNVSDEELYWCNYAGSNIFSANGGGSISIPRVGALVRVQMRDPKDITTMEWLGNNLIDKDLINELANDYAGSTALMYDSAANASIKYQPNSGITIYLKGSHILILPDNTINIHYGEGASGTQILLSQGKIDIQALNQINLTTSGNINLEADNITLNGSTSVLIKGDMPGSCAINGQSLMSLLELLGSMIDTKIPQCAGSAKAFVSALKEGILNLQIQYI